MGERYLTALREPYVNALATLRGRYVSALTALRGRLDNATRGHRCLLVLAGIQ